MGILQAAQMDFFDMVHTLSDKRKLLNRVRRLRGQIDAIERALEADAVCSEIMQRVTAARGAIHGLMAEVVNEHIRQHMIDADRSPSVTEQAAATELISVLRTYIG
jgi:DNA-binding FrmR family transcriptional regulator